MTFEFTYRCLSPYCCHEQLGYGELPKDTVCEWCGFEMICIDAHKVSVPNVNSVQAVLDIVNRVTSAKKARYD